MKQCYKRIVTRKNNSCKNNKYYYLPSKSILPLTYPYPHLSPTKKEKKSNTLETILKQNTVKRN